MNDSFTLFNLKIEVTQREGVPMICNHKLGDYFELKGENLIFPDGQSFPLYPLAALLPILPAKQRITDPNDWMTTDAEVACPDPNCGGLFKIIRVDTKTFKHSDVSVIPLPPQ